MSNGGLSAIQQRTWLLEFLYTLGLAWYYVGQHIYRVPKRMRKLGTKSLIKIMSTDYWISYVKNKYFDNRSEILILNPTFQNPYSVFNIWILLESQQSTCCFMYTFLLIYAGLIILVLVIKVLVPSFRMRFAHRKSTSDPRTRRICNAGCQAANKNSSLLYGVPSFLSIRNLFHRQKDNSGKEITLHARQRCAHDVQQDVSFSPMHLYYLNS